MDFKCSNVIFDIIFIFNEFRISSYYFIYYEIIRNSIEMTLKLGLFKR
jgi:hypothetical protein